MVSDRCSKVPLFSGQKLREFRSFDVLEEIQSFSAKSPEEQKEPEKEKSFFQKYVTNRTNIID